MGNCIGTAFALSGNAKKVNPDEEYLVSAVVDEKNSSGPELCSAMLKSGESYRIIVQLLQQHSREATLDAAGNCNGQRVKIVVSRKQLQLLIKRAEEIKLSQKWRPSLATIPEL